MILLLETCVQRPLLLNVSEGCWNGSLKVLFLIETPSPFGSELMAWENHIISSEHGVGRSPLGLREQAVYRWKSCLLREQSTRQQVNLHELHSQVCLGCLHFPRDEWILQHPAQLARPEDWSPGKERSNASRGEWEQTDSGRGLSLAVATHARNFPIKADHPPTLSGRQQWWKHTSLPAAVSVTL